MLEFWDRPTEDRLVRALDACCALLGDEDSTARRAVLQRLLAVAFEAGAGTDDPMSEMYAADTVLSEIPPGAGLDDDQALTWLERAQQHRLISFLQECESHGPHYSNEEIDGHPMWRVHRLGALARRLRLLIAATGTTATALARAAAVPTGRVGHWTTGKSLPTPAERDNLAAALGIHPGWLAEDLDQHAPADWYRFEHGCPCGTNDGTLVREPLDGPCTDIGALVEDALWCAGPPRPTGCGQPYTIDADTFYPIPTMDGGYPHRFSAVTNQVSGGNCGPELAAPWPHALWNSPSPTGPDQRGPLRLPDLLTQAPGPR